MILVTGSKGQLGGDVCEILKSKGLDFIATDVDTLDITDSKALESFFSLNKISSVIHCAAYTAVDKAEDNFFDCLKVNSQATESIAYLCGKNDIVLIYISTDYVFSGEGETPFETGDLKMPLSVYGKTKYLGEVAIKTFCKKYFIVRTSWVFGEKNTNFIHTMLKLSKDHQSVRVVCDQIGSPTYSRHLAKLLCEMVQTNKYGIYHATNEGFCSWAQLAQEVFSKAGKTTTVIPVSSDEYITKAKRPLNSRLSKSSLDINGFERLPKWECAVEEYLSHIKI